MENKATEPKRDTVRLAVVAPAYTAALSVPADDGTTLEISREGTDVPASAADKIISRAANAGVLLERK
jgi:hypothetical protein